jgi:hypothetical protein
MVRRPESNPSGRLLHSYETDHSHPQRRSDMKRLLTTLASLLIGAAIVTIVIGCTADGKVILPTTQEVTNLHNATTQAVADTKAELAKLPPDDKGRKALEEKLAKLDDVLAKSDKLLKAYESGDWTTLATAASTTVPYGGLVIALAGLGYKWYQQAQTKKALTQVVNGVEAAIPDKTEQQKQAMKAQQDVSTQLLVARIKGG